MKKQFVLVLPLLLLGLTGCNSKPPADAATVRPSLDEYNKQLDTSTGSTLQVADAFKSSDFKLSPKSAAKDVHVIQTQLNQAFETFNGLPKTSNADMLSVRTQLMQLNTKENTFMQDAINGLDNGDSNTILKATDEITQSYKQMLQVQDQLQDLDNKYGVSWIPYTYKH